MELVANFGNYGKITATAFQEAGEVTLDRLSSPRPARLRCNVCNLTDRASCGGADYPGLPTARLHLHRLVS